MVSENSFGDIRRLTWSLWLPHIYHVCSCTLDTKDHKEMRAKNLLHLV